MTCLDEQIDEQAFLYMSESMIKELIPIIGKRFSFLLKRKKYLLYKNENSDTVNFKLLLNHYFLHFREIKLNKYFLFNTKYL